MFDLFRSLDKAVYALVGALLLMVANFDAHLPGAEL